MFATLVPDALLSSGLCFKTIAYGIADVIEAQITVSPISKACIIAMDYAMNKGLEKWVGITDEQYLKALSCLTERTQTDVVALILAETPVVSFKNYTAGIQRFNAFKAYIQAL